MAVEGREKRRISFLFLPHPRIESGHILPREKVACAADQSAFLRFASERLTSNAIPCESEQEANLQLFRTEIVSKRTFEFSLRSYRKGTKGSVALRSKQLPPYVLRRCVVSRSGLVRACVPLAPSRMGSVQTGDASSDGNCESRILQHEKQTRGHAPYEPFDPLPRGTVVPVRVLAP